MLGHGQRPRGLEMARILRLKAGAGWGLLWWGGMHVAAVSKQKKQKRTTTTSLTLVQAQRHALLAAWTWGHSQRIGFYDASSSLATSIVCLALASVPHAALLLYTKNNATHQPQPHHLSFIMATNLYRPLTVPLFLVTAQCRSKASHGPGASSCMRDGRPLSP